MGRRAADSVPGPDRFSLDGSLARSFHLRDPYNLDLRIDATNFLNHVAYTAWTTTINSTTFGLPAATDPMRSLQVSARLRF